MTDHFPQPPEELTTYRSDVRAGSFLPAPELDAAARRLFIDEDASHAIDEHQHLRQATIGWLWTDAPKKRKGRRIVGFAEIFQPRGAGWARERQEMQIVEWFGRVPDFIITLSAPHVAWCLREGRPEAACALVDHELCHCAQAVDAFGAPRFNRRTGRPVFTIKGHDVEQFVGVVERWGTTSAEEEAFARAAGRQPTFGPAQAAGICGTCLRRAA